MEGGSNKEAPIFRDIRRYYCQYCGICRSKKSLITSHVLSNHQDEIKEKELDEEKEGSSLNVCDECGAEFKKPAHLKQHIQSHSLEGGRPPEKLHQESLGHALFFERPFSCPVDDCSASYRRKDHLNRHLLQHEGKLFKCPIENCKKEFTIKGNITRHLKEMHDEKDLPSEDESKKKFICSESGCGKEFNYESRLRKHMESHVKLDSVEAFCADPSCMKPFSNTKCLNAHIQSCHQHVTCEICGSKQLRKNIKRHLRIHDEEDHTAGKIKCSFEGCDHTFAKKSNLQQHIKSVHLELRPYVCSFPGCGKRFSFKHVRDNHEKSSCHQYVHGDLEEFDEQFRSRPRGGLKRSCPAIDSLLRKRVVPPSQSDRVMNDSANYMSWLLSSDNEDQI